MKTKRSAVLMILLVVLLPAINAQALQQKPNISNIQIIYGDTSTTVTWQTDISSSSVVEYEDTNQLGMNASDFTSVTDHSVTFNTTSGNMYHFRVKSCSSGGCSNTGINKFTAGSFFIHADIPSTSRSTRIEVPVTTRPGTEIQVLTNGGDERIKKLGAGSYVFRNIRLQEGSNTIKVAGSLAGEKLSKDYTILVDKNPPVMDVTIDHVVTSPQVTATVEVSEPIELIVSVQSTASAPEKVRGVEAAEVTADRVALTWDEIGGELLEYAVYRDGIRIAVVPRSVTEYADQKVASGKSYEYTVTAVSKECSESEPSNPIAVQTDTGGVTTSFVSEAALSCAISDITRSLQPGKHTIDIPLKEGQNLITFKAKDSVGFTSTVEEQVTYDTGPPQFLETNLHTLSPTYKSKITVQGRLSEPGSVTVFVNGRPKETQTTDADGRFSIPVRLERFREINVSAQPGALPSASGWTSMVKLEAVDAAGLKALSQEAPIHYQVCGYGILNIKQSNPLPDILNTRLLLEGLQQVGVSFEYDYAGPEEIFVDTRGISVKTLRLSPELAKEYDNSIAVVSRPIVQPDRREKGKGAGYIQVNFQAINDPWKLAETDPEISALEEPDNATLYDKEKRLSQHREGHCLLPGFGCMKLWLELEIPYTKRIRTPYIDPNLPRQEQYAEESDVHKECIILEVAIDKRIDPDILPESTLRSMSNFLTDAIDTIDDVLKPVDTIGRYLFYSWMVGTALMMIPHTIEKFACEFSEIAGGLSGGKFSVEVAEAGLCSEVYAVGESATNCQSCQDAKESTKEFEYYYQQIGDRVHCPAAPSLQYYLKTEGQRQLRPMKGTESVTVQGAFKQGGVLQSGSDCAAWVLKTKGAPTGRERIFSHANIENIYKDYQKHKGDEEGKGGVNCAEPHPATPECCGYEYMRRWGSACGISAFGNIDTFDEIKESACLSAQNIGRNEIGRGSTVSSCGNVVNSAAGLCSEKGGPPLETIRLIEFSENKIKQLSLDDFSKERFLYVFLVPKTEEELAFGEEELYDIQAGYLVEKLDFERSKESKAIAQTRRHFLNAKLEAIELQEAFDFQRKYFSKDQRDKFFEKEEVPSGFGAELCKFAGKSNNANCLPEQGNRIYREIMQKIGTTDEEYIVRPGEGLIRSVQCLCFPTLQRHLKMWKSILTVIRDCVNAVLFTGDGDVGVCQALISQNICDLLYEALACFTERFGSPGLSGQRVDAGLGFSNIFGALSSAGSSLGRSVDARYGESTMYKAVFSERKLVNSACMFAFTGAWDFDIGAVWDQSVNQVPIESQALIATAKRRFISFNPATTPRGLTNWMYHFSLMLAAGSDLNVEVELKCSTGFTCPEFENSECDCNRIGEKVLRIAPQNVPTRLANGEILNEEVFYPVYGSQASPIRYDTVILRYTWKDQTGKTQTKVAEKRISQEGGPPPEFCRFELITGSYRCKFGDDPAGIQIKNVRVKARHLIPGGEVFALNEPLNISIEMRQEYPSPPKEENVKYLQYNIRNLQGSVVETNEGRLMRLTTNGDFTKSLSDLSIARDWFITQAEKKQYTTHTWYSPRGRTVTPSDDVIDGISIVQNNAVYRGSTAFILELTTTDQGEKYAVYNAGKTLDIDEVSGFVSKEKSPIPGCEGDISLTGNVIVCEPTAGRVTGALGRQASNLNIRINLETTRPSIPAGEKKQILVVWGERQTIDQCSEMHRLTPQRFTAEFVAYDSDEYGSVTDRISIDPMTGMEARTIPPVTFYAVCADAASLKPLEEKAKGVMTKDQVLVKVKEVFTEFKRKETNSIRKLQRIDKNRLTEDVVYNDLVAAIGFITQEEEQILINLRSETRQYSNYSMLPKDLNTKIKEFEEYLVNTTDALREVRKTVQVTRNVADLKELVDRAIEILEIDQGLKQLIIDAIGYELGVKIDPAKACPTGIDAAGDYFECRSQCGLPYTENSSKECVGNDVCCRLEKGLYCDGSDNENKFDCQAKPNCKVEWVPYGDRYCPDANQMCCSQPHLGARVTASEQLLYIKSYLEAIINIASGRKRFKQLADTREADLADYLLSKKQEGHDEIDKISKQLDDMYNQLQDYMNRPVEDGVSKVPASVKGYSEDLKKYRDLIRGTSRTSPTIIFEQAQYPSEIKGVFGTIYGYLDKLVDKGGRKRLDIMKEEINKKLKIRDNCPVTFTEDGQYSCVENQCPQGEILGKWTKEDAYSCGGNVVCCQRTFKSDGLFEWQVKKDSVFEMIPRPFEFVNGSDVTLRFLMPYQTSGNVDLNYEWFDKGSPYRVDLLKPATLTYDNSTLNAYVEIARKMNQSKVFRYTVEIESVKKPLSVFYFAVK